MAVVGSVNAWNPILAVYPLVKMFAFVPKSIIIL